MNAEPHPDDDTAATQERAAVQRAAHATHTRLRQALHVDFLAASDVGGMFVIGWVDDSQSPLSEIRIESQGWSATLLPPDLARVRRTDVETALSAGKTHPYGFWTVVFADKVLEAGAACKVSASLCNGAMYTSMMALRCSTEAQLRATVLTYLSAGQPGHDSAPERKDALDRLLNEQRNRLVPLAAAKATSGDRVPVHNIELAALSERGGVMVKGWIDDRSSELDCVRLTGPDWKVCFDASTLGRSCREDVQQELRTDQRHPFAFWAFAATGRALAAGATLGVEMQTKDGASLEHRIETRRMTDIDLRGVILSEFASAQFGGNRAAESTIYLDRFMGQEILRFNLDISRRAVASPYVERLHGGGTGGKRKGSILVCLYGKPEFLFLQSALFSGGAGMQDYEFVYVCNSPELAERLLNEARIARDTYGIDTTLVLLPGNAGFGAANNAGLAHCRSDRVLVTNPDVFPRDADWARRHTALVDELPDAQTRLFGAPLYYDDGSLMHGGMYLDVDTALSATVRGFEPKRMLRVEHYGKGAPATNRSFTRPRPVPAVTGAFMSCSRPWFESLGGFTEDYVFGHYEDADLCLKSLERGTPAWLHDLRLWHLEGKGSTRQLPHEGGSLVNRWLFSQRWGDIAAQGLIGPTPTHPLLRRAPEALPAPIALPAAALPAPAPVPIPVLAFNNPVARNGHPVGSTPAVIGNPGRSRGRAALAQKESR